MVEDEEITTILSQGTPAQQVQELIEQALANGGWDNVTVLVVNMI